MTSLEKESRLASREAMAPYVQYPLDEVIHRNRPWLGTVLRLHKTQKQVVVEMPLVAKERRTAKVEWRLWRTDDLMAGAAIHQVLYLI